VRAPASSPCALSVPARLSIAVSVAGRAAAVGRHHNDPRLSEWVTSSGPNSCPKNCVVLVRCAGKYQRHKPCPLSSSATARETMLILRRWPIGLNSKGARLISLSTTSNPELGGRQKEENTCPMGQRRVLVIGSQCEALGRLDFLPKAAQELYRVMTDPERGACVSALLPSFSSFPAYAWRI